MNTHAQLAIAALERASPIADLRQAERAFARHSTDEMNRPYGESDRTPLQIVEGYSNRVAEYATAIGWVRSVASAQPEMRATLAGQVPVNVDGIDKLDAQLGRGADRLARAEKTIAELREVMNTFAAAGKLHKIESYAGNCLYMTFLVEGNIRLVTEWDFTNVTITPKELDDADNDG